LNVYTNTSHAIATFLFALHLSILTVWPVIYAVGIDFFMDSRTSSHYRMIRIFSEFRYVMVAFLAEISCTTPLERAILYPVIGAVAGAWLGSVAFPLDWERPWQVRNDRKTFPLPSTFGSILGHSAGGAICWMHCTMDFLIADPAAVDVKRRK
jgi:phosphatidylinositol glycan class F